MAAYKLQGRMKFQGLDISIENAEGSVRRWKDPHGKETGSTKMHCAYGYIRRTEGTDGDHVDVYIGPNPDAKMAYVIDQNKKPPGDIKKDGKAWTEFDEHKCFLGFRNALEAKKAYLKQYDDPRFFRSLRAMPMEKFKLWLASDHPKKGISSAPKSLAGIDPKRLKALAYRGGRDTKRLSDLGKSASLLPHALAYISIPFSRSARSSGRKTASFENTVHSGISNSDFGSDLLNGQSLIPEGHSFPNIPVTRTAVLPSMLKCAQDFKISDRVVEPVSIDMVDNLVSMKLSSKMSLHDNPVLQALSSFMVDETIGNLVESADMPSSSFSSHESEYTPLSLLGKVAQFLDNPNDPFHTPPTTRHHTPPTQRKKKVAMDFAELQGVRLAREYWGTKTAAEKVAIAKLLARGAKALRATSKGAGRTAKGLALVGGAATLYAGKKGIDTAGNLLERGQKPRPYIAAKIPGIGRPY